MNLFIIKKATAIYRLSKLLVSLCVLFSCAKLFAQTDLNTFCFEDNVRLSNVQQSISFLLLPKDTVNLREDDHCIDIVTSVDRGKLFEKFLAGRYNLKRNHEAAPADLEHCNLSLKTTTKSTSDTNSVKVGVKNSVKKSEQTSLNSSTIEFVVGQGIAGELEAGTEKLKVLCRLIGADKASLQFSFYDRGKGGTASEYLLKRGEWLNLGSVIKDLNEKNKTLGIPQTEISTTTGKSEIQYDLQIK